MTQREALAYGHPDYGGVVFGGANAGKYSLMGWALEDTHETRTIRATVAVHGEADIEPVLRALGRQSGNLGISVGRSAKVMTCNLGSPAAGNGDLVVRLIRTSGSSFGPEDIGMPVELVDGTMGQIAYVFGSSLAEANVDAGIDWTIPSSPVEARIGTPFVSCRDRVRAAGNASDDEDEPGKVGGIAARTIVSRIGDADDDQGRRLFELTAVFQRPAAESRVDDPDRPHVRKARVERLTTPSELQAFSFSGEVTAGVDSGGDGQRAYNLLAAGVETWIAKVLDELASGETFDEITGDRIESWDAEAAVLRFSRSYRQQNFPDLTSAVNDPRIRGATVRMSRAYSNYHGIKGARTPPTVMVNYSASIAARGANAVTYEDLPELWGGTIKPYLLAQAKALYGGTPVVLSGGDPEIDPVSSRIVASLVVFMAGSGSNVYSYTRKTMMSLSEEVSLARIHDGEPHTYVGWSPGQKLIGSVMVSVIQIGKPRRLAGEPGNPLASQTIGGVDFGNGLGLSGLTTGIFGIQQAADAPGVASPNSYESYPTPGDPARFFGGATPNDGRWLRLASSAQESPTYWGQDPDRAGNVIEVNALSYSATYLYTRREVRKDPPRPIPRPSTGGAGRGGLATVERNPLGGTP